MLAASLRLVTVCVLAGAWYVTCCDPTATRSGVPTPTTPDGGVLDGRRDAPWVDNVRSAPARLAAHVVAVPARVVDVLGS